MMNLERAISIAVEAHKGQIDKAGAPLSARQINETGRLPSNCMGSRCESFEERVLMQR